MTRHVRIGTLVAIAALLLACATGCAAGADKAGGKSGRKTVVLTLANPLGDVPELNGFRREVSRLSNGTLRIDVRSAWGGRRVDGEDALIGDVRAGKVPLGAAGSRAWDSVGVPGFRALAAPFLIQSYALQVRVLRTEMVARMLRGLRPLGLVGLGVLPGPLRRPLGKARPLLGPADYAGLRVGVQQSRVASATMRALGATPVWFGRGAPIGGFGGIEQQIESIQSNEYDRVARYLTGNVVFWPRPLVLFANAAAFARLTPDERSILRRAAADETGPQTALQERNERENMGDLCRAGRVHVVDASVRDLAALRRAVEPVYAELERDRGTRRDLAEIEALRASNPGLDAVPRCSGAESVHAPARTPIDGVWHMSTKIGDEPSDPRPVSENYGDWIFVFDRGRFAITQEYQDACTWGYGKFTVHGHEMAWTFTDGGGVAPHRAMNKPGEFFRFGWSLYRDTLSLTPVHGAISPINFRGKTWRRISSKPSARYLNKHCAPPAQALPR